MGKAVEPDEAVMARVAAGERDRVGVLLRRYASPLLTFIQRMVGDRHRSEELFQDVFVAVWNHRTRYQPPRPFRAWLFGIAVNKCRAAFRQATLHAPPLTLEPSHAVAAEPSPIETLIATETTTLVQTAVQQLPEQQRTVVVLRIWGGLPYAEIAEIAGCGEATVRSHMFHGLAGMRRYLEPRLK